MEYTVKELQNFGSIREGEAIEAKNLTDAKRKASKNQYFQGTVLVIEKDGLVLATKDEDGKWENHNQ